VRVVVTGGNGFIGSHLIERLAGLGADVVVIDHGEPRPDVAWAGIKYLRGSFYDPVVLSRALVGADLVYHLASTSVPTTANEDPRADIEGNLLGTLTLVNHMLLANCQRMVFMSSGGTVYGDGSEDFVHEDTACRPVSSYGIVKHAIERYLLMHERAGRLAPVILRASNPYGSRQGKFGIQGLVSTAIQRISTGEALTVWGDGSAVRDYLYVPDLIELMVKTAFSNDCGVFNVGSGSGASVKTVIDEVAAALGRPALVTYGPKRDFDVQRIVLDIRRVSAHYGWRPRTTLTDGIRKTISAWMA
jgi:UDP-glucose 4-epimerase